MITTDPNQFLDFLKNEEWPVYDISNAAKSGVLWELIPELQKQLIPHNSPYHKEVYPGFENSIFAHTLNVVCHASIRSNNRSPNDRAIIVLSALLHDIGKPYVIKNVPNGSGGFKSTYVKHDIVGARIANDTLARLGFSDILSPIVDSVRYHMEIHNLPIIKVNHKARRLIGLKNFDYILELSICDTKGTKNEFGAPEPQCRNLINSVSEWRSKFPDPLPPPLISLEDLPPEILDRKWGLDQAYRNQLDGETNIKKIINHVLSCWKGRHKNNE